MLADLRGFSSRGEPTAPRTAIEHLDRSLALAERHDDPAAALGDRDLADRVWRETLARYEQQGRDHDAERVERLLVRDEHDRLP